MDERKVFVKSGINLISITTALFLLFAATFANAAARVEYYHTDALGSVIASTDEGGNVLWREFYRPFGDRMLKQVSTQDNTPFYTGKPHDDATGLSYFGARYYDPKLGRFLGMDPAGVDPNNLHSFNRYAYANNNPYKYVDPDGAWSTDAHNYFIDKFAEGRGWDRKAIAAIKTGSALADSPRSFLASNAHEHAMGDGEHSAAEQREKMNAFIRKKMGNYRELLKRSETASKTVVMGGRNGSMSDILRRHAFMELGRALHAAMDSTSPSHEGFQTFVFSRDLFVHGDMFLSSETRSDAEKGSNPTRSMGAMQKVMDGKDL